MKLKTCFMSALLLIFGWTICADDYLYSSAVNEGLTFYCSFDNKVDADKSVGNPKGTVIGPDTQRFAPGIKNQGMRIGIDEKRVARMLVDYQAANNIDNKQGTILFWIKSEDWKPSNRDYQHFVNLSGKNSSFYLYKNVSNELYYYERLGKKSNYAKFNISHWEIGEWHHYAATWNINSRRFYVDGHLVETVMRIAPDSIFELIRVGSLNWHVAQGGYSIIDELKIFNHVLSSDEIATAYAEFTNSLKKKVNGFSVTVGEKEAQVDGVINPGEYTASASGFMRLDGSFSPKQSRYYLSYDKNYLYVGIETPQISTPVANQNLRDGEIWLDDSIEIWLAPSDDYRYQFTFNSKGILYDAKIDKQTRSDFNLRNYRIANRISDGIWTAEFAIPLAELAPVPKDGKWKLNIGRTAKNDVSVPYSCIAPVRKTRGFGDYNNFVAMTLKADAPAFTVLNIGNLNVGHIGLDVTAPGNANCTIDYSTAQRTWLKETLTQKSGRIRFDKDIQPNGILTTELKVDKDMLYRSVIRSHTPNKATVLFINVDIDGQKQILRINLKNESGEGGGVLHATMKNMKLGTVVEKNFPIIKDQIFWTEAWDITELPPGDYDFEACFINPAGVVGTVFPQWVRKPGAVVPWLNNKIGIYPGEVPPPWIPIKTTPESVRMLTQFYVFKNSLLPSAFGANKANILKRPAEFKINGKAVNGSFRLLDCKPDVVTARSTGEMDGVDIVCDFRFEYDGMVWSKITFSGNSAPIKTISIEFPFKSEFAEMVHGNNKTYRTKFGTTGLLPKTGWDKNLYTRPAFWVGNDTAGLSWYAENLKGWRNQNKDRSLEILPNESETIVRLNVVDSPLTLTGSRTIEFAIHGTPVKHPMSLRGLEGWNYYVDYPKYFNYQDSSDPFFEREKYIRSVSSIKKQGLNYYLYTASNGASPYCPEWAWWGKQWASGPLGSNIIEFPIKNTTDRNLHVWTFACLNCKSFRDFRLWQLNNVLHDPAWNIQHIYYDLVGPRMCNNAEHGCGWKDDDGITWPTQNVLGTREFHKRIYHLSKKLIPNSLHLLHVTNVPSILGVDSFADVIVEGETFFDNEVTDQESYFGIFTPKMFRAAYYGQKWGYTTVFIPQLVRSAAIARPDRVALWRANPPPAAMLQAIRHFIGYAFVHDVFIWLWDPAMRREYQKIREMEKKLFGVLDEKISFIPYWDKNKPFTVESNAPDRVMTSAYIRENRVFLVVMNDTNSDQSVRIKFDAQKLLGHPAPFFVQELNSGQPFTVDGNEWTATIPAQVYQMYFIK